MYEALVRIMAAELLIIGIEVGVLWGHLVWGV
jgi:hypothetical protein